METKNNTGAIFKNDNKKADNHPDYKGKVNVNGKEEMFEVRKKLNEFINENNVKI